MLSPFNHRLTIFNFNPTWNGLETVTCKLDICFRVYNYSANGWFAKFDLIKIGGIAEIIIDHGNYMKSRPIWSTYQWHREAQRHAILNFTIKCRPHEINVFSSFWTPCVLLLIRAHCDTWHIQRPIVLLPWPSLYNTVIFTAIHNSVTLQWLHNHYNILLGILKRCLDFHKCFQIKMSISILLF